MNAKAPITRLIVFLSILGSAVPAMAQDAPVQPSSAPAIASDEFLTAPLPGDRAASKPTSEPATMPVTKVDRSIVLAHTKNGDFTIGDLEPVAKAQLVPNAPAGQVEQLLAQPLPVLQEQAAIYLGETQLAKDCREKQPELMKKWADEMLSVEGQEIIQFVNYEQYLKSREMPDADLRAYYEKNKVKYHVPLRFKMRHLFLSTYVEYTSKPGDTLESIAKTISGSEDQVAGIRTNTIGKLRRWVAPEDRHRIPYVPLTAGERLLVPISKEKRAEIRKDLETLISTKLKQGESFESLCERFSEADHKGKVTDWLPFAAGKPFLKEIIDAAKTLPLDEVSDVIETPNGFEVIQVVERVDERQIPFEEAKEKVNMDLLKRKMAQDMTSLTDSIRQRLRIDVEAIQNRKTDPNKVVVETPTRKWTFAEIEALVGSDIGAERSPTTIDSAIRGNMLILHQLYVEYARETGLLDRKDFRSRLEIKKDHELAQKLITYRIKEKQDTFTEADNKKFYEENSRLFVPPQVYKVRQIVMRLDPKANLNDPKERANAEEEALDRLREATEGIKTQEEFVQAVNKFSEDPASREKGGSIGEVMDDYKQGAFASALAKLPAKTVSQPFVHGDLAYVIWVDEINAVKPKPYEEEKARVQQTRLAQVTKQIQDELMRQALDTIGFRLSEAS